MKSFLCALFTSVLLWSPTDSNASDPPPSTEQPIGTLVLVKGVVLVRPDSQHATRKAQRAVPNLPVFEGDVINTSSDGGVKLLLKDKTLIDIAGGSLFHVGKLRGAGESRQVELALPYGQARAAVVQAIHPTKGNFKLRTRTATMGVRGTEFVVQSPLETQAPDTLNATAQSESAAPPPASTTITVIDGKVEVAAPASSSTSSTPVSSAPAVTLTAGTQLSAPADSAQPITAVVPVSVPTQQLQTLSSAVVVPDRTVLNAITIQPSDSAIADPTSAVTQPTNVTSSLILTTVTQPPAEISAVTAPSGLLAQASSQPSRKGDGFAGTTSATETVSSAPAAIQEVGGGTRSVTITIRSP